MRATRRAEIEDVFEEALELAGAERAAFLDRRCAGDAALRHEVDAMLRAHARSEGILEGSAAPLAGALAIAATERLEGERRIGPYRVIRELGRGGMGVVYLAERADGAYQQQVAIKLLRASPDADELRRRFLAERQILASLDHPHIARLLDGGTTDGQLPYLVMEHVDGLPITEWCDRERLDVAARLRLFEDVCAAVQTAHQSLVIHRDLKPGNVLVTADGDVKLLDFGIAKLLAPSVGDVDRPHTRAGFRVMTPEYASPEQVRGEPLSTASDVYALGVLLYELLTGRRPYQLRTGTPRELHELVCEKEPERPSTIVGRREAILLDDGKTREHDPVAASAARGATPDRLARQLRGDVDAIVLKALRKEPRRRYGTAELLAEDLVAVRQGRPVAAHLGRGGYRAWKFIARHRVAVAAGTLAILSLGAGAGLAAREAAAARRERDGAEIARRQAEQALLESEAMGAFLVGLFDRSAPTAPGAPTEGVDALLARGAAQAGLRASQPLVQARMLDAMARVYRSLGRFDQSRDAFTRSVALRREHGGGIAETSATQLRLGDVLRVLGRLGEAETATREALRARRQALGDRHPAVADALDQLCNIARDRGRLSDSEAFAREAISIREGAATSDPIALAVSYDLHAEALRRMGRTLEAERQLRKAVRIHEGTPGPPGAVLVEMLLSLGELYLDDWEQADSAYAIFRRAEAAARAAPDDSRRLVVRVRTQLVPALAGQDSLAAAEHMALGVIATERSTGGDNVERVRALGQLARVHVRQGRLGDAERRQREAMRLWGQALGGPHVPHTSGLVDLADVLLARGRLAEADSLYRRNLALRFAVAGRENATMGRGLVGRGDIARARGRHAEADSLYRHAVVLVEADRGRLHRDARPAYRRLAALSTARGDTAGARRWNAMVSASLQPR